MFVRDFIKSLEKDCWLNTNEALQCLFTGNSDSVPDVEIVNGGRIFPLKASLSRVVATVLTSEPENGLENDALEELHPTDYMELEALKLIQKISVIRWGESSSLTRSSPLSSGDSLDLKRSSNPFIAKLSSNPDKITVRDLSFLSKRGDVSNALALIKENRDLLPTSVELDLLEIILLHLGLNTDEAWQKLISLSIDGFTPSELLEYDTLKATFLTRYLPSSLHNHGVAMKMLDHWLNSSLINSLSDGDISYLLNAAALVARNVGRFDYALDLAEQSIDHCSNWGLYNRQGRHIRSIAVMNRARLMIDKGNLECAVESIMEALALEDDFYGSYKTLIDIYLKLRDYKQANEFMKRALEFCPLEEKILYDAARVSALAGDFEVSADFFMSIIPTMAHLDGVVLPGYEVCKKVHKQEEFDRLVSRAKALT